MWFMPFLSCGCASPGATDRSGPAIASTANKWVDIAFSAFAGLVLVQEHLGWPIEEIHGDAIRVDRHRDAFADRGIRQLPPFVGLHIQGVELLLVLHAQD